MGDRPGSPRPPQLPSPRRPSPDPGQRLASVHVFSNRAHTGRTPRGLIRRVAQVFDAKVALLAKQADGWHVLVEAPLDPKFDLAALLPCAELDLVATRENIDVTTVRRGSRVWTLVGFMRQTGAPSVLVLEGEWTASSTGLMQFAANLMVAERMYMLTADARARVSSHRLARRLSRTRGLAEIGDVAVTTIARTLGVHTVSLAVPVHQDKTLQIVATYGYPVELVRGLRIGAGEGVLGRVYESRRAIRLSDIGTATQGIRRPRYGGRSAMVLPIVVRAEVLGIISVTGRQGNEAFTADDMSRLRRITGPLTLALQRERAALSAEAFAHAAAVDPVSSLFNRRHFEARLEEEVQRASRHKTDLALVMLDLDDFKTINDRFGHLVGDMMLRETAEILHRSVRRFDVCARYGGEEFAILMPGAPNDMAAATAERIRARIAEHRSAHAGGHKMTISVGVASTWTGASGWELLAAADHALYMAKNAGKNRVHTEPDAR
jgi:diguanylate cyclase (GGDEF)-like protein